MATVTNFNTSNKSGVDVNAVYAVSASVTPETPAPPFQIGDSVFGSNGTEYIFVIASTSITPGDFVAITNTETANSLTSTNVVASVGARIAVADARVTASVSYIPAGAYFWATIRGADVRSNVGNTGVTTGNVQLFTTATAGVITSVTTSSTLAAGLAGIECVASATATTLYPTFRLTWPRTVAVYSSAGGTLSLIQRS